MTAPATEKLGPAERIINSLLTYSDHCYHNRPGIVCSDARTSIGVRWEPVTHKVEEGAKVVYKLTKSGHKTEKTKVGILREDGKVWSEGTRPAVIGEYREPGLHVEAVQWMYQQIADVWALDNEFAARWASYAFAQEHRDLKVILAAFMLVQSRKGEPVMDAGKIVFHDEDYRDVGEAMILMIKEGKDLNPKLLLRIKDVLELPGVAAVNRKLGFGNSAREATLGRWKKAVTKWLLYREENPKMLAGLVKAGFKNTVEALCRAVGYKPQSAKFFVTLGWKQRQAKDGRRAILNVTIENTGWAGLNETQVCERIVAERPDWKRIVGQLPQGMSVTRAILSAAIESGCLSNKDLIILTPTIEELGLMAVAEVKAKWDHAIRKAEDDTRAVNIAKNVKSKELKEKLQEAADTALTKTMAEVTKNLRIYVIVDTSGSMERSIDEAKLLAAKFIQGLPLERTHVSVFSTSSRILTIKHASAAGVEQAFRGIVASGGTRHAAGVLAHMQTPPKDDEDSIFIFVGDGGEGGNFADIVRQSNLRPTAFGFLKLPSNDVGSVIESTATALSIPCFPIDRETFSDVYAIPRTLRALIASTPVGTVARAAATPRLTLVDQILKTALLVKPAWATVAVQRAAA
jgi:hypothetical protein